MPPGCGGGLGLGRGAGGGGGGGAGGTGAGGRTTGAGGGGCGTDGAAGRVMCTRLAAGLGCTARGLGAGRVEGLAGNGDLGVAGPRSRPLPGTGDSALAAGWAAYIGATAAPRPRTPRARTTGIAIVVRTIEVSTGLDTVGRPLRRFRPRTSAEMSNRVSDLGPRSAVPSGAARLSRGRAVEGSRADAGGWSGATPAVGVGGRRPGATRHAVVWDRVVRQLGAWEAGWWKRRLGWA